VRSTGARPSGRAGSDGARASSSRGAACAAVSLAAALTLPAGFPERDPLLFLTLCVIFDPRAPGRDLVSISDGVLHRLEREFDLEDQGSRSRGPQAGLRAETIRL